MATNSVELNTNHFLDRSNTDYQGFEVAANPYNHVEVVSSIDDFFALREQWNEINDVSLKGNLFISWEWLYTWWETYRKQGNRRLYILTCTNIHNDLLGIAPFQIVNNPKKYFPCSCQLVLLGTGETDGSCVFGEYMDLVLKPGHETAAISALSKYLYQHKNLWDGLKFKQQLQGSHLSKLFKNTTSANDYEIEMKTVEDGFRTIIELPETYQEYLMSLRKKMRNNITRTYSRLELEQNFTIEPVTIESEIQAEMSGKDDAVTVLAKLNRLRRGVMEKYSVFEQPKFELFHRRLVKRLLPLNKVSLRVLKFDNEPVASLYSFIDKDIVHAYQSGFVTVTGHRYSLLTNMLTQEISASIKNPSVSRFNFMYSNDENTYKNRYAGTTEKMYNISFDKPGIKDSIYTFIHTKMKQKVKKLLKLN